MKKALIAAMLLISILSAETLATIINVPDDQSTIQLGINSSTNGDTILVQPGTYQENISYNAYVVTLASLYLTTGDESYISSTIIEGHTSNSVVIFNGHGENSASLIGFTITGGNAAYGGGVYSSLSSPIISNNVITSNYATYGGGIYCINSDAQINDNTFIENTGMYGGAACIYQETATLSNNTFDSNTATEWGGGILCYSSECYLYLNTFTGNSAITGGGIYYYYSTGVSSNNIVMNNTATNGAGVYSNNGVTTFVNNLVYANEASTAGGGMYCISMYVPFIANSIFWANTAASNSNQILSPDIIADVSYCVVQDGWEGDTNLDDNPMFRDAENGDFHLMATEYGYSYDSPCIDAGHPDIWDLTLNSEWGLGTYLSDIGSYGGRDTAQVLPAPVLLSPYDGEQVEEFAPTLMWQYEARADSYEVQVDDDPLFVTLDREYITDSTYWTVEPDLVFGTWYWRARSHNQLGWGSWADYWYFTIGGSDIDSPDDLVAREYSLSQCYPNPFNAQTTITIGLPTAGHVSLDIYDILGRKVETLIDGYREAGYHQLTWNADGQSSGIYLYRVETDNYSATKSMLLLK